MKNYEVRVFPKKDADGDVYWTAEFPAIEGCVGGGATAEEAIKEAEENLEIFLEYLESEKREIPKEYEVPQYSGKIALRTSKSTHRKLAQEAEREGVSINLLINSAIENYLGLNAYDYELSKKIQQIRTATLKSLNMQEANLMINQQLLSQWSNISGTVITIGEGEE